MMKAKNIMLLHGWGAETVKLTPLKKALEANGWKVFLPEIPGFGAKLPETVWGLSDYSDYFYSAGKKYFGGKFIVFGHSFGGRVAIRLSVKEGAALLGTVLCAAGGLSRGFWGKRLLFYLLAKAGNTFRVFPRVALRFRKLLYKAARERDYFIAQGIMKNIFKKVVSENLKKEVKNIIIPTLILWGDSDRMTPVKDARYLISNIDSKLESHIIYKNFGHRLPYEAPDILAGDIDKWYKSKI